MDFIRCIATDDQRNTGLTHYTTPHIQSIVSPTTQPTVESCFLERTDNERKGLQKRALGYMNDCSTVKAGAYTPHTLLAIAVLTCIYHTHTPIAIAVLIHHTLQAIVVLSRGASVTFNGAQLFSGLLVIRTYGRCPDFRGLRRVQTQYLAIEVSLFQALIRGVQCNHPLQNLCFYTI